MRRRLPLLLLLVFSVPAMAGGIYQWVDAEGKRHFTSTPPPGVEAQRVKQQNTSPGTSPSSGKAGTKSAGGSGSAPGTPAKSNQREQDDLTHQAVGMQSESESQRLPPLRPGK